LAAARRKKIIDKQIQMQSVQYKALMTVRETLPEAAVREDSFGGKTNVIHVLFAPRDKRAGKGWNVPVNNC
jgi:hypothetical protein